MADCVKSTSSLAQSLLVTSGGNTLQVSSSELLASDMSSLSTFQALNRPPI